MKSRKNFDEIEQDLLNHQNDPDEWSDKPESPTSTISRTAVVSCRMPKEEFLSLTRAAKKAGESISDYIRSSIKARQESEAKIVKFYPNASTNSTKASISISKQPFPQTGAPDITFEYYIS